jgi:chromosome segregation ATPase
MWSDESVGELADENEELKQRIKELEAVIKLKGITESRQRENIETLNKECDVASRSIRNYSNEVQEIKKENKQLREAIDKFMAFDISPCFDAKATYTTKMSNDYRELKSEAQKALEE